MATAPYQIEKNVPLTGRSGGGPGSSRFPFAQMEVGDSFHVPCDEKDRLKVRSVLSNAAAAFQLRNQPKRFSSRKDDLGFRVWRIA